MCKARPEYHKVIRTHVLEPLSAGERHQLRTSCERILGTFDTDPSEQDTAPSDQTAPSR